MYFADGFLRHILFMAMVLWNRYIFVVMWWSQKSGSYFLYDGLVETGTFLWWWSHWWSCETCIFYFNDLADGLCEICTSLWHDGLVKQQHFCSDVIFWHTGTFSLWWSCETATFLWWWYHWWSCETGIFSLVKVLWNWCIFVVMGFWVMYIFLMMVLSKQVYFMVMTLLMVFWDMYILFMMVLLNSNIFVVMVFWNRYIFFIDGLLTQVHFLWYDDPVKHATF